MLILKDSERFWYFFLNKQTKNRLLTHRYDPGDNHDDGEDKTDDVDISFAVERTLLVFKFNLE